MFRTLVSEQEDLAWAPQPFAVLEMAIVRLASLPDGGDVAQLIARLDALEKKLAGGAGGSPSGGASSGGSASPAGGGGREGKSSSPTGRQAQAPVASSAPSETPAPASIDKAQPIHKAPPINPPQPIARVQPIVRAVPESNVAKTHASDRDQVLQNDDVVPDEAASPAVDAMATPEAVLDRLRSIAREQNQPLFHSLDAVRLIDRSATNLHFAASSTFHTRRLEDRRVELEALCQRFFGKPMRVEISQSSEGERTSTASAVADDRELDRQRRQAALNHPSINLVLKKMRGEIIEIQALDGAKGNSR